MKLASVHIQNFRAIDELELPLDHQLNVLVGENAAGKTSVLEAIATGLGEILTYLPDCKGRSFKKSDLRADFLDLGEAFGDPLSDAGGPSQLSVFTRQYVRVYLSAESGPEWDRTDYRGRGRGRALGVPPGIRLKKLHEFLAPIVESVQTGGDATLPVLAYYGTDRAVQDIPQRRRNFRRQFSRFAALDGALEAGFRFKDVFEWIVTQEDLERRGKEERRDFDFRLPVLEAVRIAVSRSLPGCANPRTELHPLRLVVDMDTPGGGREHLALDQLSGGYRVMLALVIDLARRTAQANPHLGAAAIDVTGVVLIDEVDLHLHPRWQQRILPDLLRAFPNVQFVVTTHSPQVLTTVQPHQIVILERQASKITAGAASSSYGAESGRLLEEILGVDQRPPAEENEFTEKLRRYANLVAQDRGEEDDALRLRRELDAISPQDPGLIRLDMEIRRRRVLSRAKEQSG
jgi:predicted ATP-binding protein involved in virulence